ncbi:hypothetical protein ACQUWL_09710 [Serratia marcescens]|uniref:hypothetical protein n=1 Tax=Serratia marcescens TaxID=615 RepID=UPI003D16B5E7
MSMTLTVCGDLMSSSKDRLRKALKDNRDSYTISKDGHIQLNLNNKEVIKAIEKQIALLGDLEEVERKIG